MTEILDKKNSRRSCKRKRCKRKRRKKRKLSKIIISIIVVFQIITASFVSCLLVFYGPFPVVRKTIVGTAMSSYKHQYIAKIFLSDKEIGEILDSGMKKKTKVEQKISNIKIKEYNDHSIERYDIDSSKFKGCVLVIKNPLRVKVGYTKYLKKAGESTSNIAKAHNAVAAINGGGFTDKSNSGKMWAGTGAYPTGCVISNGEVIYKDVEDDEMINVMAIDKQGKMILGKHSINDLKKLNVSETIAFGPPLIVNGELAFEGDGGQGLTARTAIGQRKDGAIILLVLDGRRLNMPGANLEDIQKIMMDYNVYNATNLDGGSSSTMYYEGKVINNPCNPLGERAIATALYVEP